MDTSEETAVHDSDAPDSTAGQSVEPAKTSSVLGHADIEPAISSKNQEGLSDQYRQVLEKWVTDAEAKAKTRTRGAVAWASLHKFALLVSAVATAVAGVAGVAEWISGVTVGAIALAGALGTALLGSFDPNNMRESDRRKSAEWTVFAEHCDDSIRLHDFGKNTYDRLRMMRDNLLRNV